MDQTSIIDLSRVFELVEDDKAFYLELTEAFFDELPEIMRSIKGSIEEKNGEDLHRAAHTVKGALGNLCAMNALELAKTLEMKARSNDFTNVVELVGKLEEAITQYQHVVAQIRSGSYWEDNMPMASGH